MHAMSKSRTIKEYININAYVCFVSFLSHFKKCKIFFLINNTIEYNNERDLNNQDYENCIRTSVEREHDTTQFAHVLISFSSKMYTNLLSSKIL